MMKISDQNMQNKKIIIYGAGQVFEQYKGKLNWDNVVAIVDMDSNKQQKYIFDRRIESPEIIGELQYDYVAIFTDRYFESAKVNLIGNFFVPEHKIVSWRIFKDNHGEYEIVSDEMADFYTTYLENREAKEILDVGKQKLGRYFFHNELLGFTVDNYCKMEVQFLNYFYRDIYNSNCENKYDVIFLWGDYGVDIDWNSLVKEEPDCIIWTIHYSYLMHQNYIGNIKRLESWGRKKMFLFPSAIVNVFEKQANRKENNCEIFVVTHKKYNVLFNDIYKPVCIGNYTEDKFCSECMGDNIAYLNDRINECTALYWIWKNTTSEYAGLNHYRRFFYNSKVKNSANYLSGEKIEKIFNDGFDIILPELTRLPSSVIENIRGSVGDELCSDGYRIIYGILKKRSLQDAEAFAYVMSGNVFYKCNMFVMKRKELNVYCEWLFSFLIEATEQLDVSLCDAHHKRTMGYFAETMLTVWLLNHRLKIKELPVTDI